MGLRHWFKKAGKAIEKTAKDTGKAIEKTANQAVDGIDDLVKEAEKSGMSVIDDIKNLANKAKNEVEGVAKKSIREVEGAANKAKKEVEQAGKEIEKRIPELAKEAIQELAKAITKEGLKRVRDLVRMADRDLGKLAKSKPDLVGAINNLSGTVELGPLTLKYSNFYNRTGNVASVLDTYINHPPQLRRGPILKMVEALGPTFVDTGISVQVVALVVGSKELGVGGGLGRIELELFLELGDVILEKLGIPE